MQMTDFSRITVVESMSNTSYHMILGMIQFQQQLAESNSFQQHPCMNESNDDAGLRTKILHVVPQTLMLTGPSLVWTLISVGSGFDYDLSVQCTQSCSHEVIPLSLGDRSMIHVYAHDHRQEKIAETILLLFADFITWFSYLCCATYSKLPELCNDN